MPRGSAWLGHPIQAASCLPACWEALGNAEVRQAAGAALDAAGACMYEAAAAGRGALLEQHCMLTLHEPIHVPRS